MHGDGYCDDKNNNKACFFDGGDCCGSNVNTDDCTECHCHCNASSDLIGNGFCNEEINTIECNYDGGDCCGLCQTILVTLEGNALVAQSYREGLYHKSSEVNGKESWTSTLHGIWYYQAYNGWNIGHLDDIGENAAHIFSVYGNQCPFNLPSEKWQYGNNGWKYGGANEVNVHCLWGNFSEC